MGKACHPLTAILFLKEDEGRAHDGKPIRPATVSARVHALTRLPGYRGAGHLRADYEDIEDCGMVHVTFSDGTVADVFASEVYFIRRCCEIRGDVDDPESVAATDTCWQRTEAARTATHAKRGKRGMS